MTVKQSVREKDSISDAVDVGLRIIAGADQSVGGLRRRLAYRGYTDETVEAAVLQLAEFGYINDEKLSASVTTRKLRDGFGRRRIAADLRGRGVADDAIDVALSGIDSDVEFQACREAADKWLRGHPGGLDRKQRDRMGAALQRRGFGFDVIRGVMAASSDR